jgi:antitoxin component HigA of HigAB toxin-antitoxin module
MSEILSGKRAIGRAQAKKLAGFLRVSAELFL